MRGARRILATLFLMAGLPASAVPQPPALRQVDGELPDGALWRATIPSNWNGTLLLWSHGYSQVRGLTAEDGPSAHREKLLAAGYALAGSTYADGGWALESAVPIRIACCGAPIGPIRTWSIAFPTMAAWST